MMKATRLTTVAALALSVALTACNAQETTADIAAEKTSAAEIIQTFGKTLKGELQTAMKAEGPVAAINVCHEKAPAIAKTLSEEHGVSLSRVSLKNRNPEQGKPNDWQTDVLKSFDERLAAGEAAQDIAFAEVVETEGKQQFRLMKAVATEAICLVCHGENVPVDVSAKLKELYPDDLAVGYQEGQIRGAFLYIKDL